MESYERVNKLITELSEYYQLGVLTNGSKECQLDKLEAVGLARAFDTEKGFISGEIGY